MTGNDSIHAAFQVNQIATLACHCQFNLMPFLGFNTSLILIFQDLFGAVSPPPTICLNFYFSISFVYSIVGVYSVRHVPYTAWIEYTYFSLLSSVNTLYTTCKLGVLLDNRKTLLYRFTHSFLMLCFIFHGLIYFHSFSP